MTWTLKSATTVGDRCRIVYESDEVREDGTSETKTVYHERATFNSAAQTDARWRANIKREITADLSELNQVAPVETDITSLVK